MHKTRHSLSLVLLLALAFAQGCFSEPPRPEPTRPPADAAPAPVKFAAIADAGRAAARVPEVVSDLSAVPGLDFVFLAGNNVANADAAKTPAEVKELASAFGILTAKKYVVLGKTEKEGAAPAAEVARAFVAAKLLPSELGFYSDVPRPGVRVIVIDMWVGPDDVKAQRGWLAQTLHDAKEDTIVVAAASEFGVFGELLEKDPRVKAVVLGSSTATDWKLAKAIVDAPSLARDGAYVSVTLDKFALVERVLTPGNPAPRLETKHTLK